MALTNAQVKEILSEAGVPAENVEGAAKKIIDGHVMSITALREERDTYKVDAEKLPAVQKELDALKAKGDQNWQQKFEDEHTAFESFKTKVSEEKNKAEKTGLYTKLLKDCNVDDSRISAILKVTDIDGMTVKDGKLEKEDSIVESIKSEWAGFINTERKQGASVETPPANNGGEGKSESRAAKIAAQYHESLYGKATKGE